MKIKPPAHLTAPAKALWAGILEEFDIEDSAGVAILIAALESRDLAEKARKTIKKDGLTVSGRDGQLRPHPLLTVERDNRAAFLAGLRQLNLDLEPLRDRPGRPVTR